MNTPTKTLLALSFITLSTVLAQNTENRIVNIQGAPQGNVRTGPLNFSGNPLKASVSTLSINSKQATLSAPKGKNMLEAKGSRTAVFSGDVVVTRGKLNATGGKLNYSESTGIGMLTQSARAIFKSNNDDVLIKAESMSLDVDKNISTSEGSVLLQNGNQNAAANKLIFDEDKELGVLTGSPRLRKQASKGNKELLVTGNEVRALTSSKTIFVKGNVKLVQGDIVTTGDAMFYDDNKNIAYVVGNAVSKDNKSGNVVKAPSNGALEQRTDLARVSVLNSGYKIPTELFKLRGE